jgi:2OG-Fe dioxygenase
MTGIWEYDEARRYAEKSAAAAAERDRVQADLLGPGWALTAAATLGLPPPGEIISAFAPALVPDPRGRGKLHARDVLDYDRRTGQVGEAGSVAHIDGTDDFSRFRLTEGPPRVRGIAAELLTLIPSPLRHPAGRLSVDYFRYVPGTLSGTHQDGFGDVVVIWVLARDGGGGESYLTGVHASPSGVRDVFRGVLDPGQLLIFRDALFVHGLTTVRGSRDALIIIALKDT